ncbi:MAG: DUF1015 domain-containing protein [Clostridia bacterium]|nr:DUF1015 domain-containing protein [Clostridia bacterium]
MNKYKTIFQPAEILLPAYSADAERMSRWAVIACDQYTSEPDYWESCVNFIDGAPSAYDYILPEAYLGTDMEKSHGDAIASNMKSFAPSFMRTVSGLLYVERTLPDGTVRHGIVGAMDLEAYDYSVGSASAVRATEATILTRIPPRCKVRASAAIELPHILVLVDNMDFIRAACAEKESLPTAYDFDLMGNGGHIIGREITGEALDAMMTRIAAYEEAHHGLVYAMGDGNHSLAAAKAHWENVKAETGDMTHPARFALCELTALEDDSLVFHPIYRILKNCDPADVLAALSAVTAETSDEHAAQTVTVLAGAEKHVLTFTAPDHALTVGTLQNFLDRYHAAHPETECDYIHGEDSVVRLSESDDCVGFLMNGMDKSELFPYVEAYGTLPRKTFSMGEADSKRYYLEARKITK